MSTLRAFTMPKWGIEMTEGTLTEWSINQGDWVSQGQTIALIESDKIVNEVQAEGETRFVRLIATAGESYPVGALLGVMASGEVTGAEVDRFIAAFRPAGIAGERAREAAGSGQTDERAQPGAPMADRDAQVGRAAPAVGTALAGFSAAGSALELPAGIDISSQGRRRAIELNVDVRSLTGSGRRGRITLQDVEQASRPARTVVGGAPVSITPTTAALDAFYASPGAKRLALAHNIDLASVRATGPRGRISRADVAREAGVPLRVATIGATVGAAVGSAAGGPAEVVRMSPTRRAIARQLSLAKTTIPHYYLRREVQIDALQSLRAGVKAQNGRAPSLNDYIVRAAALALREVPDLNIQVHGEEIHRFTDANIAVAVDTDRGLITPVLRAAQRKSVDILAAELRSLVERARAGRLRAEDVEGGTFTVSNLGMYGVEQFYAIINPPQGAILAVGAARRVPIEANGGGVGFGARVWLSLSCDHRAIDGALGGRFLAALRDLIESPQRL